MAKNKLPYKHQINLIKIKQLIQANEALLHFIRTQYPDDFKEGGRGFTCAHHQEIDRILKEIIDIDELDDAIAKMAIKSI